MRAIALSRWCVAATAALSLWLLKIAHAVRQQQHDLVIEDTKMDRYLSGFEDEPGVAKYWKAFRWSGPASAVRDFLQANPDFEADRNAEPGARYSQHVGGYLRRIPR